ncbi:MAG: hypothetical protein JW706_02410 [Opitutales bacterium]|nr:hypothetical protein [Opitutales bacterium]
MKQRTSINILGRTLLGAFVLVAASCGQPLKTANKTTVILRYQNGDETKLDQFYRKVVSHAHGSRIRTDTPTTVEWEEDMLELKIGRPDHPYSVQLPFAIIDRIQFGPVDYEDPWYNNQSLIATVYLGDGTTLKGGTWGYFLGNSSLGEVSFDLSEAFGKADGLIEIDFMHDTLPTYSAKQWGTHVAEVTKRDGSRFLIEQAAFSKSRLNENACWLGDQPSETLDFERNSSMMEIKWKSIAKITPNEGEGIPHTEKLLITGTDGTTAKAYCPPYMYTTDGIKGLLQVTPSYRLLTTIELVHYQKAPFSGIELKHE